MTKPHTLDHPAVFGGTPKSPFTSLGRSVCDQTLPTTYEPTIAHFLDKPASVFTDTALALIVFEIPKNDLLELAFLVDHATAVAGKVGTARLWLANEWINSPVDPRVAPEYFGRPVVDLTLTVGANAPLVTTGQWKRPGVEQAALVDTLAIGTAYAGQEIDATTKETTIVQLRGRAGQGGMSVVIDPEGANIGLLAVKRGTLAGILPFRKGI